MTHLARDKVLVFAVAKILATAAFLPSQSDGTVTSGPKSIKANEWCNRTTFRFTRTASRTWESSSERWRGERLDRNVLFSEISDE